MLAWREMTRVRGRFAAITAAVALIAFLAVTLSALADGLFYGATGAVRSTTANAYVTADDSSGSFTRSSLSGADVQAARQVPGVQSASALTVILTTGQSQNNDFDLAVFGIGVPEVGMPSSVVAGRLPRADEANAIAVDDQLGDDGVGLGSVVVVGGQKLTVVGVVSDVSYQLQPSAWTSTATATKLRAAVEPETQGQQPTINAVALDLADGVSTDTVSAALPGTQVMTSEQSGLAIPGVSQQKSTLNAIIVTTFVVSAIVVALFFALIVLEKRDLFATLKAIGTPSRTLFGAVVIQALLTGIVGTAIGIAVGRLFGTVLPATVPTLYRPESMYVVAAMSISFALIGSLFTLRRVARIDPATAIGGSLT